MSKDEESWFKKFWKTQYPDEYVEAIFTQEAITDVVVVDGVIETVKPSPDLMVLGDLAVQRKEEIARDEFERAINRGSLHRFTGFLDNES